jgi:alkylhydroperoxidase/carboxymuconolactone decarboxylase family protein YurZ
MPTDSDAVDAALREVEQRHGRIAPAHRRMAEYDLEFFRLYTGLVDSALGDGEAGATGGLPAKYREIVLAAILAFRAGHFVNPNPVLVHHVQRALDLGATRQEIFDGFKTAMVPGGAPTFMAGIAALLEAEKAADAPSA